MARPITAFTADGHLSLNLFEAQTEFLTGETTFVRQDYALPSAPRSVSKMLMDTTLRSLFVADAENKVHYYDLTDPATPRYVEAVTAVAAGKQVTAMEFLVGSVSLILGGSDGSLSQWFLVRDEHNNFHLKHIRDFEQHSGAIQQIIPEYSRKGFMAIDVNSELGIHYGTSARTLLQESLDLKATNVALSPINTEFLVLSDDGKNLSFCVRECTSRCVMESHVERGLV